MTIGGVPEYPPNCHKPWLSKIRGWHYLLWSGHGTGKCIFVDWAFPCRTSEVQLTIKDVGCQNWRLGNHRWKRVIVRIVNHSQDSTSYNSDSCVYYRKDIERLWDPLRLERIGRTRQIDHRSFSPQPDLWQRPGEIVFSTCCVKSSGKRSGWSRCLAENVGFWCWNSWKNVSHPRLAKNFCMDSVSGKLAQKLCASMGPMTSLDRDESRQFATWNLRV